MKSLKRAVLAAFVCYPILMSSVGCEKVYVKEEIKSDTTTGTHERTTVKEFKE